MLDLPGELLDRLFHGFPLANIIALRRVCKKFRDVIDFQMRFKELSVFVGQYPFDETLFQSKESIDLNQAVRSRGESLDFLRQPYFKSKFQNIEKLLLFVNPNLRLAVNLDESGLDYYQNLVHLEIHHVFSMEGLLKLTNLQRLSIDTIAKCEFQVDCDSLLALNLDGEASANLIQPHRISYLESPTIVENFYSLENLNTFVC